MEMARRGPPARPMLAISLTIPGAAWDGLSAMARKAGYPKELFAANLLMAAYTAKVGPTGDDALDASVARIGEPGNDDTRVAALEGKVAGLRAELNNVNASLDQSRRKTAAEIAKMSELQKLLHGANEEIDGLKDALDAEKMKHAEIFCELHAARQELEALKAAEKKPPIVTITADPGLNSETKAALIAAAKAAHPLITVRPEPEALAGLADCTRRMIIALKASGLTPKEIARETDTPVATVAAVLDQAARPRNRKAGAK